ncbi:MAG: 6-phosphofructokinase [Proteobacteria bacterium]|nr:6-phosphofructokinase [Pseudomonadota bacterium]
MKRIGILTGGGDVPGLNAVIKAVVYGGTERDFEVIGIRKGWEGLTHVNLDDPESHAHYVKTLTRDNTRTIDRTGGTFLHTSRTNPSKMKTVPAFLSSDAFPSSRVRRGTGSAKVFDMTSAVMSNIERLGIEHLIVIGGDDTLSYASRLDKEGVKVIAIPKTMDNDVQNTEYCIGFSTAITRAMSAIERQLTTVGSHERIGIFRVFGRDAGFTALYTAYVTSLRCAIPEHRVHLEKLVDLVVTDKRNNPSNYSLVIVSEGATWKGHVTREYGEPDAYGHRKKVNVAEDLSDEIKRLTGQQTIVSDLTYDLRSGEPDFMDRLVGMTFGNMALDCLTEGTSNVMMAVSNGCFDRVPIPDPAQGPRRVDVATMYDTVRYRPNYRNKLNLPIFLSRV